MIVFKVADEKNYLKRVIGIAGDTVEVIAGNLYINGVAAEEPYLQKNRLLASRSGAVLTDDFSAVTVPDGSYFVLGGQSAEQCRFPHDRICKGRGYRR